MKYQICFSDKAVQDIVDLKKSKVFSYHKLKKLLLELEIHPHTGTGKPEILRYRSGYHSRRIDKKNRLIYHIDSRLLTVRIISAKGHYDD